MIKKIITILLAITLLSVPVYAQEAEYNQAERIQYSTALRGALRNRPVLTQLDDIIDDVQEMREDLQSLLELRRAAGTITRAEEAQMVRQIANLGAQLTRMRTDQEMYRIRTEFAMRSSITAINNAELNIELLIASLEHERALLVNTRMRVEAGLASESDLRAAELALEVQESNLAENLLTLETQRQSLNQILQRPVTADLYIYFEREMLEFPTDLNAHIRRYAPRQPNVRRSYTYYNRARAELRDFTTSTPEWREAERARNNTRREYNDILRRVETDMRNHYNTLNAMQHNIQSLEINLLRENERLEAVTLNYQAGLATRFDIEAAQLAVLRAETAIEQALNNYWNVQFAFEHPFLIPMVGGR